MWLRINKLLTESEEFYLLVLSVFTLNTQMIKLSFYK